jgi:hypothetical protein
MELNMNRKLKLGIFGLIQIIYCGWTFADVDFVKLNEGQENPDYVQNVKPVKGFIPYSKAFIRKGPYILFVNPQNKRKTHFNFTGLKEIPVKPGTVYSMKITAIGQELSVMDIFGIIFKDKKYWGKLSIIKNIFFLNVNGMTTIERDFTVPLGASSIVLDFGVGPWEKGKVNRPGTKLIIQELTLKEKGRMKTPSPEILGKNFLPMGNFGNCKNGDFAGIFKGCGKTAKHWPDIEAKIVKLDGLKCLRIKRTPQSYPYPHITSKRFPFNPQYYYIKVSVTARGKGEFNLGLWWKRDNFNPDYSNRIKCILSKEWQTFTETRACLSPLVSSAALAFYSKNNAEIYIKDISLKFISPK